ncbi:MAG: tRNA (N6-threonylcarbamoyladenosine(37)-N6)-methyltransferase TrmO [Dehalococcoidia bacterium]|nr:tRNA (N6-threonylcarbamoyladenosine(37)-N6)-methyltransferase TrmO [Dehalococcoidia bacterium]
MVKRIPPIMTLQPIGVVRNKATRGRVNRDKIVSRIIVNPEFEEGLEGLNGYSHILVLVWMHRIDPGERSALWVHPRGRHDVPMVGVFAGRGPARPNPIGLTTVKLLGIEGNILTVAGLDAYSGTPVLDIKPHIPSLDAAGNPRIPDWMK